MKEIKRLLKPGGYVELRDIDPMLNNMGPISSKFFAKCKILVIQYDIIFEFISSLFLDSSPFVDEEIAWRQYSVGKTHV